MEASSGAERVIASDQSTIFPDEVLAAVSSSADGTIWFPPRDVLSSQNLKNWCEILGVPIASTVGLLVEYSDKKSYTDIIAVDQPIGQLGACDERGWIEAEALLTTQPQVALVLPVADCNAVIFHDSVHGVLGLAHLGWHSTINNLATAMIEYMGAQYDSLPADIRVYSSPSIRRKSYIFDKLHETPDTRWHQAPYATKREDGRYEIDLVAYNLDALIAAGVQRANIEISPVDVYPSDSYSSHRRSVHEQAPEQRFAVLAMLR